MGFTSSDSYKFQRYPENVITSDKCTVCLMMRIYIVFLSSIKAL